MDEPFEYGTKTAMYPGDFGDPAEDCNCRCAALKRARASLDADELERMKERAKFFGLDKLDDFAEFERKYLKAASEEGKTASNPVRQTDEKAAPTAKTSTTNTAKPVVNSGESGIISSRKVETRKSILLGLLRIWRRKAG